MSINTMKCTLALLAASCILVTGCHDKKGDEAENAASSSSVLVPVRISELRTGDIESYVVAVGTTEALRREKVLSPVAGKILTLNALEGSAVHRGDVLITLRTREAQSAVDGAQALLHSAVTDRQKEEAARAIQLADSSQSKVTVRANFDGIVVSRNVAEGELVSDQTELLTVIDPSTIVFMADVPLKNVSEIHPHMAARVSFPQLSSSELEADVDAISPQADPQSQSLKIRLSFRGLPPARREQMKASLSGVAKIITGVHKHILCAPRSALLHDDESGSYSLAMMTPDSVARIVPVTVGIQNDSVAEVRGDRLRSGQFIITSGQYALTDSARVVVEQP